MQNPNLPSDSLANLLTVALLGFETLQEENFRHFFVTARQHQRQYQALTQIDGSTVGDILIVNYDNPSALIKRDEILQQHPQLPIVAVSRGPLATPPPYHIRGMLFAARVLTTLDKVIVHFDSTHQTRELNGNTRHVITPVAQVIPLTNQDTARAKIISAAPSETATALPSGHTVLSAQAEPNITEGYRVLVVDDSPAIQKSLELNLATLKSIRTIDFADNGENALAKADMTNYDLIFLDVMMPGIDGYETCSRLRLKAGYKKTPIIMVSGKTSPLDEVKGVMAGCTTYLTKPVKSDAFQKLGNRVLSWLEKNRKSA